MRYFILNIILFLSLSIAAKGKSNTITREDVKDDIIDTNIIDAKLYQRQGKAEESLKKGLEVLSSAIQLTPKDSFHIYSILASGFSAINVHETAFEHANKSAKILARISNNKAAAAAWMPKYCIAAKQYTLAIKYLKLDLENCSKTTNTHKLLRLYNDIGFIYYKNHQQDSSIHYYLKVIEYEPDSKRPIVGVTTGNLGMIYFDNADYKKAIKYLQIDVEISKGKVWESYCNAMNGIADCHYQLGNYSKANKVVVELLASNKQSDRSLIKSYKLLANIYQKTNQEAKSARYLRKYYALEEALRKKQAPKSDMAKQIADYKLKSIQLNLKLANNEVKLLDAQLTSEALQNKMYLFILIMIILAITMAIIYYNTRQRKNKAIHQLESDLLSAELKNKQSDLVNFSTNLSYKRKFINDLQDKLKQLQNSSQEDLDKNLTLLIRELNSYENSDKGVETIQADMDKVNSSFFNKLGEKFPALTQNEKELCGLFMLKLSSKDIATIRSVSVGAIKKARHRIRKKLPINESEEIITFLENL